MNRSFRDIIALWPSLEALAADISAEGISVKADRVSKWKQRDSIPGEYWQAIVTAAKARGHVVTTDEMAAAAAASAAGAAA